MGGNAFDGPCLIKWIGSKRVQSREIIQYFPSFINTYYEPFCGGCSVMHRLMEANVHNVEKYICSDINGDLIDLLNTAKRDPDGLFDEYTRMWTDMKSIDDRQDKKKYFEMIREEFNQTRSPYCFFFLMRTCTNGIPRYNRFGNFNNTFHITRDGIQPKILKKILYGWSETINDNDVEFRRCDYRQILENAEQGDFVYLDPPYEMTRSTGKYFGKINYYDLFDGLRNLNSRDIKYALSYDNITGDLIVPDDCYENQINIGSRNWGYRQTLLKIENDSVYENLYVN